MPEKKWTDNINSNVAKEIDEYVRGKYELTDDEINTTMPKVVEFYNKHPDDKDVYRDSNGCILLIQTPKVIVNDKNDVVNKLMPFDSEYSKDQNFLLKDCKFRINGDTKTIGLFATKEKWTLIEGIYDKTAFIKVPTLTMRYKKLGEKDDKIKPMALSKFLQHYKIKSLDEIPNEWFVYYSANITQVIK